MFDKTKENAKYQQVKAHIREHKREYIIGVSCLTVGIVGIKASKLLTPDVVQTFNGNDNLGTVVNKSKNVHIVIKYLNQRNYPANPVRCVETLEEWASQAEAALAKGVSETNLSQHLNGKYPHANGLHFERINL